MGSVCLVGQPELPAGAFDLRKEHISQGLVALPGEGGSLSGGQGDNEAFVAWGRGLLGSGERQRHCPLHRASESC